MLNRTHGHRFVLAAGAGAFVLAVIVGLDWQWISKYSGDITTALWKTLLLLISTVICGFALGVLLGLAQLSDQTSGWISNRVLYHDSWYTTAVATVYSIMAWGHFSLYSRDQTKLVMALPD